MLKFIGEQCPVCDERFVEKSDVVVCPDCGTPHHRSCYAETNKCAMLSRHESDYEFKSSIVNIVTALDAIEVGDVHLDVPPAPLPEEENKEEKDIFGVSGEELSVYMEIPKDSYAYKKKIEEIKPISINIFAGLFAPFYQFYKGMRLFGFLLLAPMFLVYSPEMFLQFEIEQPHRILMSLFGTPENAETFASFFTTGVSVLLILFNDYIYVWFCANKIKKIRAAYPEGGSEYMEVLRSGKKRGFFKAIVDVTATSLLLGIAVYMLAFVFSGG
ncbi:MAG: hypothetical protein FWD34_00820 [Oscillospiraceae bacterium]|nr:hypothetical protein [Oscillospiraceae bacterium]